MASKYTYGKEPGLPTPLVPAAQARKDSEAMRDIYAAIKEE